MEGQVWKDFRKLRVKIEHKTLREYLKHNGELWLNRICEDGLGIGLDRNHL